MRPTHIFITLEHNAAWEQQDPHLFYRVVEGDSERQEHVRGADFLAFVQAFQDIEARFLTWVQARDAARVESK